MRMIMFTCTSEEMPGIEILGLRMAFAGEGAMKKTPQELEQAISESRRCISFFVRKDGDAGDFTVKMANSAASPGGVAVADVTCYALTR